MKGGAVLLLAALASLPAACGRGTREGPSREPAITLERGGGAEVARPLPLRAREADSEETRALRERLVDGIAEGGSVTSARVLAALRSVPRHEFVTEYPASLAYADHPLPIGYGQTISQPTVVGMMTEALSLSGRERVLEVGTGSGYQAAVLTLLAGDVYSIQIVPELADRARRTLDALGYDVQVRAGDGYRGWPEAAPFDRILLTAAPEEVPEALVAQLAEGGILVAPVGPAWGLQELRAYQKRGGKLRIARLGPVRFVPMVPGPDAPR